MERKKQIQDLRSWYKATFRRPLIVVFLLFAVLEVALLVDWTARIRRDEYNDLDQTAANLAQALNQKNRDLLITLGVSSAERLKADSWTLCDGNLAIFSVPEGGNSCTQPGARTLKLRRERDIPAHLNTKLVVVSPLIPNPESFFGVLLMSIAFALLLFQQGRWLYRRVKADIVDAIADKLDREEQLSISELEAIRLSNKERIETAKELARQESLTSISRQVAHDVRSPLAVLNMVMESLPDVPTERRNIVRNATQRINDIANQLLQHGREVSGAFRKAAAEPVQLVTLLDEILSEKRVQFRNEHKRDIQGQLGQGYGLFSRIDATELARALSNLVNNAVEATGAGGVVSVSLAPKDSGCEIRIEDNGKGIPEWALAQLGKKGLSFGKSGGSSGSGLGVYHAKKLVEEAGGSFSVSSREGKGTEIALVLPKAEPPEWFVERLELPQGGTLVSFDDDGSIHQVWKERLEQLRSDRHPAITHVAFSNVRDLEQWLSTNPQERNKALFLVDYEISNHEETGLQIISRLQIGGSSVLVTSRFEEKAVRQQAAIFGVRAIAKNLAHIVPLSAAAQEPECDAIQIDDDAPLRQMWADVARRYRKRLRQFGTSREFLRSATSIERHVPLYIDVELEDGARGEDIARAAHAMGFRKIYLSTGYSADQITKPDFVLGVHGKHPPWTSK